MSEIEGDAAERHDPQITSPRPWSERSNTVGILPGGTTFQVDCLVQILGQLPAARESNLLITTAMGEAIETSADELCRRQLSPMGIVVRIGEAWHPTAFSRQWFINTSNGSALAVHLHNQCKFIGELLNEVGDNTTQADLLRAARSKYVLSWEKQDPIRRRLAWLRSLGMVEIWGRKIVLTESGSTLLAKLTLATSEEAAGQSMSDPKANSAVQKASTVVLERLLAITPSSLINRKEPIGYIPRGANRSASGSVATRLTALEGLRKAVGLIDVGATVDEFRDSADRELGVGAGSFNSMLHSLRHLDFIELIAYNKYGPTELAYACLAVGREADLIRFLHSKFAFIGELLEASRDLVSTSQLLAIARSRYQFSGENSEIRTRVALLADCGFLERFDKSRSRLTALGEELLSELPLQESSLVPTSSNGAAADDPESEERDPSMVATEDILNRLQTFGTIGSRDKEFEIAVRDAFEMLGLRAKHISGQSDTDVLVTADLPADSRYSAIIEVKSTSQGSVPEGQINFEAIKRHRKRNAASYAAVVGVKFPKSVMESAASNGMAVITIEDLSSLLQEHSRTPLTLHQLRNAFDPSLTNLSGLQESADSLKNDLALTAAIISVLQSEATEDDPEARGSASPANLRFALRSTDLPFRPTSEQIVAKLNLLTHPTISAAREVRGENREILYAIADDPRNIARRLRALADQIEVFASREDD
ncbi:hypothetical protein [Cryptosporangium phraense]|uniref:Restriction endonuclease type IV Mrr domain-containing protein n=1 Tax=Cryptosporangium phraense TaxID=2593070 RepID=A0A545AY14_9ACTN|nr:hypothetical protein [Cryptosporangium phraense]TQS46188.1 hypothetical protein FL583_06850 [Cryptosporangium phraense]